MDIDIDIDQLHSWFVNSSQLARNKKKYAAELQKITAATSFLPNTPNTRLPQRIWHILQHTNIRPRCKCSTFVSWDHRYKKYKKFCGNRKCYMSDPSVRSKINTSRNSHQSNIKRQQTCLDRYGHTNFLATTTGKVVVKQSFDSMTPEKKLERYSKVKRSRDQTIKNRYGVDNISHLAYIENDQVLQLLTDKQWLIDQHHGQRKSAKVIGEELNISSASAVVRHYLKKHDIDLLDVRLPMDTFDSLNDKQWLINQHHGQRKSAKVIGEELNISSASAVVRHYLKKHDIDLLDVRLPMDTFDSLNDKQWLIDQHHTHKKSQSLIASELNIKGGATVVGKYLRKHDIEIMNPSPTSVGETQLFDWLTTKNIPVVRNDRTIIAPLELDIYLPNHNIAIEYCGLYWHSEVNGKDRNYHANKQKLCKQQGIQLITLYEDEWKQRIYQVQSKIESLLGMDTRSKVYARNTLIKPIPPHEKKPFLEKNHIQGNGPSTCAFGAFHNNQLVAVMTFIKQGNTHTLTRYATSCRVIGGFSKLLAYFGKHNKWEKLISFADLRWSTGNLYHKVGWTLDSTIRPDYYYSPNGHDRFHKFNYRRKHLPIKLKHFDSNLSETVNCDNNGILRIWDCGKQRWVLNNSPQG
jgi:hypothetical protein